MWVLNEINKNNQKRNLKFFLWLFFIFILVFWYFYFYKNSTKIDNSKYAEVLNRDIYSTLSSDGKVYYKEQYDLNFQTNWTLEKLYKTEWDEVSSWEIIAKLDDRYLQNNLLKANIALQTANANLEAKLSTKW